MTAKGPVVGHLYRFNKKSLTTVYYDVIQNDFFRTVTVSTIGTYNFYNWYKYVIIKWCKYYLYIIIFYNLYIIFVFDSYILKIRRIL